MSWVSTYIFNVQENKHVIRKAVSFVKTAEKLPNVSNLYKFWVPSF